MEAASNELQEVNCCEDEDNFYEDDSITVICGSCKEWTAPVKCKGCRETIFSSSCCG